jgi:hypothetical protein
MAFLELKLKDDTHILLNIKTIKKIEQASEGPEWWRISLIGDFEQIVCKVCGKGPDIKKFHSLKNVLNQRGVLSN